MGRGARAGGSATTLLVIGGLMSVVGVALGLYLVTHGRVVIGVLLLVMGALRGVRVLAMHQRRKHLQQRFPGGFGRR